MLLGCKITIFVLLGIILFLIYWNKRQQNKLLERLQRMIDYAGKGCFTESKYEESRLSELEMSMWHFLCNSNLLNSRLEEQKQRIQTLISDISHQTVTPIANIKIYTELVEEQIKETDKDMVQEISAIKNQVDKLDFLIESMVKLSRLENGVITVEPKENEISEVLEAMEEQYKPKAKEKQVELNVNDSTEHAYFDSKWTIEALGNLVDNAIKYTECGGKVTVKAIPYSSFLRIDVTDTGIGIDEKEIAKIFSRFYRSRKVVKKKGVGIGLFLAREIVKREKGYLKVSSKLGEGSTFSLFLYRGLLDQIKGKCQK